DLASSLLLSGMALIVGTAMIMAPSAPAWGQGIVYLGSQDQSDPVAMYGHCGAVNSGIISRIGIVLGAAGADLNKITAITVLDCHTFDGPGNSFVVPCPAGAKATYCVQNQNDGVGNHILLGVTTDKNFSPCQVTGKTATTLTITFSDRAFGLSGVELRGAATNVTTQFFAGSGNRIVVLVATKINKGSPGSLSNVVVGNGH